MLNWLEHLPRLEFEAPLWLLLLPFLLLVIWLKGVRERKGNHAAIMFPGLERLQASGFGVHRWLRFLPQRLRWSALFFCIVALSAPRLLFRQTEAEAQGIDVILALDISESMLKRDFTGRSRLDAAREVARNFVLRRSNDRIGLVVFRGEGYTQCPLTLDHEVVAMLLDHLSPTVIQDDGTAIGTAILIAVNRLKASESSHKIVILVTDGENNAGEVSPATAAGLAAQHGIKIYAINAGFKTVEDRLGQPDEGVAHTVKDEVSLQEVVKMTGGGYFSVEDPSGLDETIRTIDRQEKHRQGSSVVEHRSGLFFSLLGVVVVLFFVEVALSHTRLLKVP